MTENQIESRVERAVLVGLSCPGFTAEQDADERTMAELKALAETAGAEAAAMTLQRRPAPDARPISTAIACSATWTPAPTRWRWCLRRWRNAKPSPVALRLPGRCNTAE